MGGLMYNELACELHEQLFKNEYGEQMMQLIFQVVQKDISIIQFPMRRYRELKKVSFYILFLMKSITGF